MLISDKQLRGHLAMWVCRQHPYNSVVGVDEVGPLIDLKAKADDWSGNDELRMRHFDSYSEVEQWLRDAIGEHPQLSVWNTPKSAHGQDIVFVSRYGGPRPEDDFIDISALFRNIALEAWRESEREDESNKRIDDSIRARTPSVDEAVRGEE